MSGLKDVGLKNVVEPARRALEGQCLAIPTYLNHQTKPCIKIIFFKSHLNRPGQRRVNYIFHNGIP